MTTLFVSYQVCFASSSLDLTQKMCFSVGSIYPNVKIRWYYLLSIHFKASFCSNSSIAQLFWDYDSTSNYGKLNQTTFLWKYFCESIWKFMHRKTLKNLLKIHIMKKVSAWISDICHWNKHFNFIPHNFWQILTKKIYPNIYFNNYLKEILQYIFSQIVWNKF